MGDAKNLVESNVRLWNEHNRGGWTADFADTAELKAPVVSADPALRWQASSTTYGRMDFPTTRWTKR